MFKRFPVIFITMLVTIQATIMVTAVEPVATTGAAEPIELYMHNIIGGSNPTARPITGLLGNIYSGQVPFARPVGFVPPKGGVAIPNVNGAIPTVNGINGIPLGTGLAGTEFAGNFNKLGSQPLGKAQGIYVASSAGGTTQMMAFTAMMEGGEYVDSLNFYEVYRIGGTMSKLSVTGGTGKFKNACGFAEVRSLIPPGQHVTDGAETSLRITIHLT
ncbi:Dirigent protein [Dillenia turbinata]|uniref:Dirigent protein n=1 Tax=Dillenia turbinata TaxID=194707 RepID=A0AAN8Z976_9MAGN